MMIIARIAEGICSRGRIFLGSALTVSIIIAFVVFSLSKNYYEQGAQTLFESEAKENADAMKRRIEKYENLLQSGAAFFHASQEVSRDEWHHFITTLQIEKFYPGVQGIGYVKMLRAEEVEPTVAQMRTEGYPSFTLTPAGKRELYSSILYIEPMDRRNVRAIGYDMYSEPLRREAMQRARDASLPMITAKVRLVQEIETDIQPGFLMYLPIYNPGESADTLQERRRALAGFVYSPFRMKDLMESLNVNDASLYYEIYDGKESEEDLLYRSVESPTHKSHHHHDETIQIGGRVWHIHYLSTKHFDELHASGHHIFLALATFSLYIFLMSIILKLLYNRKILKQKRDALQQEKETAQSYLDIADVIMLVCDSNLNVQLINRYGCEVIGYTPDGVIGKNWIEDFLPASIRGKERERMQELARLGDSIHYENTVLSKEGEERLVSWRTRALFDKKNRLSGYLCSGDDITQMRRAQIQLKQSEEFYRTIFSSVTEAIFILHDDKIVDCNELAMALLEREREEIIGRNTLDWAESIECRKNDFKFYLKNALLGEYETVEAILTLKKSEPETKVVEFMLSRLGSRDENKLILISRDISGRVEEERLLKMHARQAQMGEMISMIAHQWRQPLSIINSVTSQLRLKAMMDEVNEPFLSENLIIIEEQSSHLSQTISEYRDFFHPNKPKEHFHLCTLVQSALNLVDHALKNHSIEVELSVESDPRLFSYRNEILQVLIALLKNSMDAFVENSVQHRKIVISIANEEEYGSIIIFDNAGGIASEILEKIFLPYITSKNQNNGTGLGLYMSKMIIEGHCHGVIHASSKGDNAVFTIKLPLENR